MAWECYCSWKITGSKRARACSASDCYSHGCACVCVCVLVGVLVRVCVWDRDGKSTHILHSSRSTDIKRLGKVEVLTTLFYSSYRSMGSDMRGVLRRPLGCHGRSVLAIRHKRSKIVFCQNLDFLCFVLAWLPAQHSPAHKKMWSGSWVWNSSVAEKAYPNRSCSEQWNCQGGLYTMMDRWSTVK